MAMRTTDAKGRSDGPKTTRGGSTTTTMEADYEVVRTCANVCNETLAYCLGQGGDHVEETHIRLLVDCAEICNVTANLVGRGSEYADNLMEVCGEVSKACEESCEGFEGDETMTRCADACRACAEHCGA